MSKKFEIYHPQWNLIFRIPPTHKRRCDVCKEVMDLSHYYFQNESFVRINYICQKTDHARIKYVCCQITRQEGLK